MIRQLLIAFLFLASLSAFAEQDEEAPANAAPAESGNTAATTDTNTSGGVAFEACMRKNCEKKRGNPEKWGKCYEKKCTGTKDLSSGTETGSGEGYASDDTIDLSALGTE